MSDRNPATPHETADAAGPGEDRSREGIILLSPGTTAPEETARVAELARTLAAEDGFGAGEAAHMRYAPPGLLDAVARVVGEGVRRVRVVPLLLFEERFLRDHLPALVEAARRRHPGVAIDVAPPLSRSPALLASVRLLLDGRTV